MACFDRVVKWSSHPKRTKRATTWKAKEKVLSAWHSKRNRTKAIKQTISAQSKENWCGPNGGAITKIINGRETRTWSILEEEKPTQPDEFKVDGGILGKKEASKDWRQNPSCLESQRKRIVWAGKQISVNLEAQGVCCRCAQTNTSEKHWEENWISKRKEIQRGSR